MLNRTRSKYNREEVLVVIELLEKLLEENKENQISIGVVTPYRAQADFINRRIEERLSQEQRNIHNIECSSAHRFQGAEKDIIIYSNVIADNANDNWYQRNGNILNVALSRAKKDLYIVGDKSYCERLPNDHILNKIVSLYNFSDNGRGNCAIDNNTNILYDKLYQILSKSNIDGFGCLLKRNV